MPAFTPFQRLRRPLQPRCARPATSPAHPLRCPAPNPSAALAPAVFPAAAPAPAAVGGRAWSGVVAVCPVWPAKQIGRSLSGRALVLRIKPGKPPPVLTLRASIPNAFGPTGKLPPDAPARYACKAKPSPLPAVTPLAFAPLRFPGHKTRPGNPRRGARAAPATAAGPVTRLASRDFT
jgi:hypothetical protein